MRKTKIICTIGPASEDLDIIMQMMEAGMNVARLNFSHGTHEEHRQRINKLRYAGQQRRSPLAIMLDTRGPEIRTGLLENKKVQLKSGQQFNLTNRSIKGDESQVEINYANLPREVHKDNIILLADGLISLLVKETTDTDIICRVMNGGELGERKGVNVPGVRIELPFMSDKDREDILFGIEMEVDFIAASFVRSAEDVIEIKRILEQKHADIDVIAKIESQEGVNNLEDIIQIADGIMVARGDLGVEIAAEEVPLIQKEILKKCSKVGKPAIIATQMLDSMIVNPRPTRAEVSDVANGIFDGSDAIMLSGETAAGKYPVEVVETMARVAYRAEQSLNYGEILRQKSRYTNLSVTDAISYATCATAANLGASKIITATQTGQTARMIAKYRPQTDIIATTTDKRVMNKLSLLWGVQPILIPETIGTDELFEESIRCAMETGLINNGELVVLTAGIPTGRAGATSLMKVHIVGEILVQGMGIGSGVASGIVRIIRDESDLIRIEPGDIVAIGDANSSLAPYLKRIAALVAEAGGLTSDAAIMGLNARIPVIVGAVNATHLLEEGMLVTVDAPRGRVYKGLARAL
ncbi:MAG: pyruvate kinase [Syntrophomonadaceae bacterium]